MKRILLVPNIEKDVNLNYSKQLIQLIQMRAQLYISEAFRAHKLSGVMYKSPEKLYEEIDFVIVLGGDGTLLGVAKEAAFYRLPVLGINLGRLGFLAEVEKHEIADCLDKLFADNYVVEERMMLRARLEKKSNQVVTVNALNDIVVSRASFSRLIDLNVMVNNEFVDDFKADGIIVATPTGSTAYSLSAGGPIVDPSVKTLIITPICPHKMYSRTIVVPDNKEICIYLNDKHRHHAMITVDGQDSGFFDIGDKLLISKSDETMRLIRMNGNRFYSVLRHKLTEKDI